MPATPNDAAFDSFHNAVRGFLAADHVTLIVNRKTTELIEAYCAGWFDRDPEAAPGGTEECSNALARYLTAIGF